MAHEGKVLAALAWCSEFDGQNPCETARREFQKWSSDSSRDTVAFVPFHMYIVNMHTNEYM